MSLAGGDRWVPHLSAGGRCGGVTGQPGTASGFLPQSPGPSESQRPPVQLGGPCRQPGHLTEQPRAQGPGHSRLGPGPPRLCAWSSRGPASRGVIGTWATVAASGHSAWLCTQPGLRPELPAEPWLETDGSSTCSPPTPCCLGSSCSLTLNPWSECLAGAQAWPCPSGCVPADAVCDGRVLTRPLPSPGCPGEGRGVWRGDPVARQDGVAAWPAVCQQTGLRWLWGGGGKSWGCMREALCWSLRRHRRGLTWAVDGPACKSTGLRAWELLQSPGRHGGTQGQPGHGRPFARAHDGRKNSSWNQRAQPAGPPRPSCSGS